MGHPVSRRENWDACVAYCLKRFLVLVGTFNQEKALVGAFTVIVKSFLKGHTSLILVSEAGGWCGWAAVERRPAN